MIETTRQNYKTIAILISTLGAGLPVWTRTVRQIDFTDPSFLGLWLFTGILISFISLFFINLSMRDMITSFTVGYVLSVVGLFTGGILISNHVHGQLILALPLSMGIGIISGFTGSVIWTWIKRKDRSRR
ncbi:MAG: hypothetical protein WD317_04805 [Balneolaceae bacterium]